MQQHNLAKGGEMNKRKKKMLGISIGIVGIGLMSFFAYDTLIKPAEASSVPNKKTSNPQPSSSRSTQNTASTTSTTSTNSSTSHTSSIPPQAETVAFQTTNQSNISPELTPQSQPQPTIDRSLRNQILQKMNSLGDHRILMLGDSQVGRTLSKAAQQVFVPTFDAQLYSWYFEGTTPKKIINKHIGENTSEGQVLKNALMQKFPIVFIQLGDNGISGSTECLNLLNYINSFYPSNQLPLIVWSGPFPLCLPNNVSTSYVKAEPCSSSDPRCITNYQERKKNVDSGYIYQATSSISNARFVSPYYLSPFNVQNARCFTSDGVHILQDASTLYLENILGVEPT